MPASARLYGLGFVLGPFYSLLLNSHAVLHEPLLRYLLSEGANPSLRSPQCHPLTSTALDAAAAFAGIETLKLLIEHGARFDNSTPLHSAASSPARDEDRLPVLEFLLDQGLNINGSDEQVNGPFHQTGTPLNAALSGLGRTARVRFLLERGAQPNERAMQQAGQLRQTMGDELLWLLMEARRPIRPSEPIIAYHA